MIHTRRDETNCPLSTLVSDATGGVAGLTVVVAIRIAHTKNNYLDFDDWTFKTAGWVRKQTTIEDLGGGFYAHKSGIDISSLTNLPDDCGVLAAEYTATGAVSAIALDSIEIEVLDRIREYGDRIYIQDSGSASTDFPSGTSKVPCNIASFPAIMAKTGLYDGRLSPGAHNITADIDSALLLGSHSFGTVLVESGGFVERSTFQNVVIMGTFGSSHGGTGNTLRDGACTDVQMGDGSLFIDSLFIGAVTPLGSMFLIRCLSTDSASLDCGSLSAGDGIVVAGHMGDLRVTNLTEATCGVLLRLNGASVILDATCTAGAITVSGIGTVQDNSAGASVDITGLVQEIVDTKLTAGHGAGAWTTATGFATAGQQATDASRVQDLWRRMHLDPANPRVDTPESIKVPADGSLIDIELVTAGTTITGTRSP